MPGTPSKRWFAIGSWIRAFSRGAWAPLALAGLAAAFFWKVLFLGRTIGGLDVLEYFFPYRSYARQALDSGHLPLWNPFIFGGVPFLANIQTAIFYPPSALFYVLDEPTAYTWSVALHVFLGALFTYLFARQSLGTGQLPALISATIFGFGGFFGGQTGHLNQLSVAAWLPALLLCWDKAVSGRLGFVILGSLVVGLQFLGGHSQESYLMLVALLLYAAFETLAAVFKGRLVALPLNLAVLGVMLCLGAALAAIQLLPTAELTSWGIRGSGLSYQEATTFSLKGTMILNAILPPFQNRAMVEEPGGTEFLGYVSVGGLVLALASLIYGRRRQVLLFVLIAAIALLLAIGQQNPLYPLLFRVVPGLNLFRVPARWLYVYTFAMAALAGLGADALFMAGPKRRVWPLLAAAGALSLAGLAFASMERLPSALTMALWAMFGAAALAVATGALRVGTGEAAAFVQGWRKRLADRDAAIGTRWRNACAVTVFALIGGELWLASQSLDYNHPTLPNVFQEQFATLDFLRQQPPGFRVVSVAQDTFSPSVEPALRLQYHDVLSEQDLVTYLSYYKLREILEPNTTLAAQVPSIDGYDGGLLPLSRYVGFKDALTGQPSAPDDRIRFVLRSLPNRALLDLAGVRYVAMDSLGDKSDGDVKYDLSSFMRVNPADPEERMALSLPAPTAAVGVVLAAKVPDGTPPDAVVATLSLDDGSGNPQEVPLRLGGRDFGKLPGNDGMATFLTVLPLDSPLSVRTVTLSGGTAGADVYMNGLAFIAGDGSSTSPLVAPGPELRRAYQGDVKLYENLAALGPAFLVHRAQLAPGPDQSIAVMISPDFDPAVQAVVEANPQPPVSRSLLGRVIGRLRRLLPAGESQPGPIPDAWLESGSPSPRDAVTARDSTPEHMAFDVQSDQDGFLVLTQSFYPGWEVTVDGLPDRLVGADDLFQAVHLTAGNHRVEFTYAPRSVLLGAVISLAALAVCLVGSLLLWQRRRPLAHPSGLN
jgi:hypothetical protein